MLKQHKKGAPTNGKSSKLSIFVVKTFFNSNLEFQYEASYDLEQKSKVSLRRFKRGLYKLKENVKYVWVLLQFLFFAHVYINIYNFYFFYTDISISNWQIESVHFLRRQLRDPHFFQNCGTCCCIESATILKEMRITQLSS